MLLAIDIMDPIDGAVDDVAAGEAGTVDLRFALTSVTLCLIRAARDSTLAPGTGTCTTPVPL